MEQAERRPASPPVLVRDWLLLVLAAMPVGVALTLSNGRSATATLVVCAVAIGAALRLRHLIARGRSYALDAAFWLFLLVFITVPFVAQVGSGVFPLDRIGRYRPSASDITTSAVCLMLGALGYETGWQVSRLMQRRRSPRTGRNEPVLLGVGLREAQMLGALIALAACLVALARHGLSPFLTSRQAVEASYYGTGSELRLAHLGSGLAAGGFELQFTRNATALGFLTVVAAGHRSVSQTAPGRTWPRAAFLAAFISCALVNGPLAASRTVTLSVALGWWLLKPTSARRRGRYGAVMVAGALALLVVFPSLDLFRVSGGSVSVEDPITQLTTDLDYTPVEQSMRVASYVEDHGHSLGRQVLGAVGAFVPRSVWTEKPRSTTYVVSGDTGLVIGTPIWAEGYLEFGYLGAFLYPFCLGALVRRLSQWGRHATGPVPAAALALSVGVCVLLVRGDLLSSTVTVYGLAGVAIILATALRLVSRNARVVAVAPADPT